MFKNIIILLFIYFFSSVHSQCSDPCICTNYVHDENNPEGLYQCSNMDNCECGGTRMCSNSGWCNACTMVNCPPYITACPAGTYQNGSEIQCLTCDTNCAVCTGLGACTSCSSGVLAGGMCITLRSDYNSTIYASPAYTNPNADWLYSSIEFCPDETWAMGYAVYSNCQGLGIIDIELKCGDINGNYQNSVIYALNSNLNGQGTWQIAKYCTGVHFLQGILVNRKN